MLIFLLLIVKTAVTNPSMVACAMKVFGTPGEEPHAKRSRGIHKTTIATTFNNPQSLL